MDLRQLRYLMKIVELGSFSKAAEALNIAQPALSQQIANLEAELDIKLLVRSSIGTKPTEMGKVLYRHAQGISRQVEQAVLEVSEQNRSPAGLVSIGLPMSIAAVLAIPLLMACKQLYPRIVLQLVEGANHFLAEMLVSGRIDAALLYGQIPAKGIRVEASFIEELFFISSKSTVPADALRPEYALAELAMFDFVLPPREAPMRIIVEQARKINTRPLNVVAELHALPTIKAAIIAGIANSILPWSAVKEELSSGRLSVSSIVDPKLERPLAVVASDTLRLSQAASKVLQEIKAVFDRLIAEGEWNGIRAQA